MQQQWIEELLGFSPLAMQRLVSTLVIVIVLVTLRFIAMRMVYRQTEDVTKRYHWRKGVTYVSTVVGVFLIGRIWFEGIQSLATFLGLIAAGLAIALQDIVINFAGWLFILWRRPFEVGDRVEIGGHAGDVIDQRVFMFSLMEIGNWVAADQSTGRVIHIPNGLIFKNSLANYNRGFNYIWHEIPVLVTFESDWEKAKRILQEIADVRSQHFTEDAQRHLHEAAKRWMIRYDKLMPIVWTSVQDSGILLTIRYLCDPRTRRGSEQTIWEDILRRFAACPNIDFAYPTTRFYDNRSEGKLATPASDNPTTSRDRHQDQV